MKRRVVTKQQWICNQSYAIVNGSKSSNVTMIRSHYLLDPKKSPGVSFDVPPVTNRVKKILCSSANKIYSRFNHFVSLHLYIILQNNNLIINITLFGNKLAWWKSSQSRRSDNNRRLSSSQTVDCKHINLILSPTSENRIFNKSMDIEWFSNTIGH